MIGARRDCMNNAAAADNGVDKWIDVKAIDQTVLVHVGGRVVGAVEQGVDKRVDVQAVHVAVAIYITSITYGITEISICLIALSSPRSGRANTD